MTYNYNPNFYNNFTFQAYYGPPPPNFAIPPPPIVPQFLPPNSPRGYNSDQDYVKTFTSNMINEPNKCKPKKVSISQVREQLRNILSLINNLKKQEKCLKENFNTLSETEWEETLDVLKRNKLLLDGLMIQINDTYLDVIKNSIAKRSAKRLRMKRIRMERKRLKEERKKESQEKSRKIDENLQKIKDDIDKAKKEEESRINTDIILKDVTRKKHDAKKCIAKLDALIKLRIARQNTARGRGMEPSENDTVSFNSNIDKLRLLWIQKLSHYEKEESELLDKMQKDATTANTGNRTERRVIKKMSKWRKFLFGADVYPQADFNGDAGQFIDARSKWDQYIHSEGLPLPIGWVVPS